jgi:hypothetical protein
MKLEWVDGGVDGSGIPPGLAIAFTYANSMNITLIKTLDWRQMIYSTGSKDRVFRS